MTEHRSPIEQALDLVLYAPVGLALTARQELPGLIEKGRLRVSSQVALARMIGQFAVSQGQQEASKVARQAGDALIGLGILPGDGREKAEPETVAPVRPAGADGAVGTGLPAVSPDGASADAALTSPVAPTGTGPRGAAAGSPAGGVDMDPAGTGRAPGTVPSSDALAIPGYDSLSASQVVQRLAGLAPAELEAVRDYEATTRGRRTVLNRVAQLQSGAG